MMILKEKIYSIFSFLIFLLYLLFLELSAGGYPSDQPYMHSLTIFKNIPLSISLIFIFIFVLLLVTKMTKYLLTINVGIILFFIFRIYNFYTLYKRLFDYGITMILFFLAIVSIISIFISISRIFRKSNWYFIFWIWHDIKIWVYYT
mgnify:CR=1 FL=1